MLRLVMLAGIVGIVVMLYFDLRDSRIRYAVQRRLGQSMCRRRGHRRSARHVRKSYEVYSSRCVRCGVAIHRQGKSGEWIEGSPPPELLDAQALHETPDHA